MRPPLGKTWRQLETERRRLGPPCSQKGTGAQKLSGTLKLKYSMQFLRKIVLPNSSYLL